MSASVESIQLDEIVKRAREDYRASRPESERLHERATHVMPGGNTRTVLYHSPFPLRVERANGSRIVDVDGHEYLDLLGEYTAGLYGHDNAVIQSAVREALDGGLSLGAHNRYEIALAEAVVSRFPALELVRFTNSGTEANLMAVALARVVTGRPAIAVITGGYHGGLMYYGGGGSPVNAPFETVLLDYNDTDGARAQLGAHADRIAAVVVEPMLGSAGCIPGTPGFLLMLREETRRIGALLIADEVMTSRLAPGGLSLELGLAPDLVALGKYLGGGLSFGAFGGRADLMRRFDPASVDALPHAGTFNNNVLTMAAGVAGLTQVLTDEVVADLNARGDRFRTSLARELAPYGWTATGRGSMVGVHPVAGPVTSPADLMNADARLRELLFLELLERGIYMAMRGFMALSIAITDADIEWATAQFADAIRVVSAASRR